MHHMARIQELINRNRAFSVNAWDFVVSTIMVTMRLNRVTQVHEDKVETDNADTYIQLGLAYEATARWADATASLEKSIKLKPDNASAYYQLGQVYERLDDADSALSAYREAVRLNRDYALAHYALGIYISNWETRMQQWLNTAF
jgi:tetratricopeptide (TPR) repeat protein